MNLNTATKIAIEAFRSCAFRFFDGGGYGINYKKNNYYFLDEVGARLVREAINFGLIDTKLIASDYGVDESIIIDDAINFLTSFSNSEEKIEIENKVSDDEKFFEYFSENLIPLAAIIEVTEACNEHCIHCYRPNPKKEYWTAERFEKTCAQLSTMGSLQIDFTGGEPFLKKNFLEYLRIADSYGFIVSILTNATLIDDKTIDVLNSIKLRSLYVSIYSADASIHDNVTRLPGSFQKTLSTITKLKALGIPIFLNASIMNINRESPREIKALADDLGLDVKFNYKISESYSHNRTTRKLNAFSKGELLKMIEDPKVQLYSDLIEKKKSSGVSTKKRVRSCDTGFPSITISPDGNIIPCTALRMECGNIGVSDLIELWKYNNNINYWREKGSLIKDKCKSCSSYDFCEPCPAGYFSTHGNLNGIDEITCGFGKTFSSCISCR